MSGAGRKQAEKDALLQTGEALGLFVKRCFLGTKKSMGIYWEACTYTVGKTCGV